MFLISLVTSLLLGYGLFNIITEFVHGPTKKARNAVLSQKSGPRSFTESLVIPITEWIHPKIRLSNARKDSLQKSLYAAEMHISPEYYTARAIANALIVGAMAIPMFFIIPFMSIAFLAMGIVVYFRELESVEIIVRKKKEKIEQELVLFASTIQQTLLSSRDVVKIFESYRKVCGPELMHELDVTLADMKTGNYESALIRFETRVNSPGISQIVRGLQAVMRGDEQSVYFEMLTHDLIVEEKERLRREALKRPSKLKVATFMMIGCFALVYFYAIGLQIFNTMKQIF